MKSLGKGTLKKKKNRGRGAVKHNGNANDNGKWSVRDRETNLREKQETIKKKKRTNRRSNEGLHPEHVINETPSDGKNVERNAAPKKKNQVVKTRGTKA